MTADDRRRLHIVLSRLDTVQADLQAGGAVPAVTSQLTLRDAIAELRAVLKLPKPLEPPLIAFLNQHREDNR